MYDKDLGAGIDGLVSDEATKVQNKTPTAAELEDVIRDVVEDCVLFLEQEANVYDLKGDFAGALVLRKAATRMRAKMVKS